VADIEGLVPEDVSIEVDIAVNLDIGVLVDDEGPVFIFCLSSDVQICVSVNIVADIEDLVLEVVLDELDVALEPDVHSAVEDGGSLVLCDVAGMAGLGEADLLELAAGPAVVVGGAVVVLVALRVGLASVFLVDDNWLHSFRAVVVLF